jgi:hypothetical protein
VTERKRPEPVRVPQAELVWNTTFHLRWLDHLHRTHAAPLRTSADDHGPKRHAPAA